MSKLGCQYQMLLFNKDHSIDFNCWIFDIDCIGIPNLLSELIVIKQN